MPRQESQARSRYLHGTRLLITFLHKLRNINTLCKICDAMILGFPTRSALSDDGEEVLPGRTMQQQMQQRFFPHLLHGSAGANCGETNEIRTRKLKTWS